MIRKNVKKEVFKIEDYTKTIMYNKQGKPIYSIDSDGDEEFYEYDKNGNCTKYISVDGDECIYKYDEYGNITYSKEDDKECFYEYEYYE